MTKNSDDRKHAMKGFSFLQIVEKSFFEEKNLEKNVEKCHFSYLPYRPLPYSSRDGENMLYVPVLFMSLCTPPVEITPKILAKFAAGPGPAGTGSSAKPHARYSN
jgi:hypothetical protein